MPRENQLDYETAINSLKQTVNAQGEHNLIEEVAQLCISGLQDLRSSRMTNEEFPDNLPYFSKNLRIDFLQLLSTPVNPDDADAAHSVFFLSLYIYAIFLELALVRGKYTELNIQVISFFSFKLPEFPQEFQARIELMRINVMAGFSAGKTESTRESIQQLGERYTNEIGGMAAVVTAWDEKLSMWSNRASELESKLEKLVGDLNFVGLASAFKNLIDSKTIEKRWQVSMMLVLGTILTIIPSGPLIVAHIFNVPNLWSWANVPYYLPFLVLELLFLYFFRIFVNNFYSVKAQLLQLQLRYNICAFIQGYAEFSDKHKKGNDEKLFERFEALVFSGISADIKNIPNHYDGIEQLGKLIKDIKNS
jgi:hypothetical protein